jgi:hypothetical protein
VVPFDDGKKRLGIRKIFGEKKEDRMTAAIAGGVGGFCAYLCLIATVLYCTRTREDNVVVAYNPKDTE